MLSEWVRLQNWHKTQVRDSFEVGKLYFKLTIESTVQRALKNTSERRIVSLGSLWVILILQTRRFNKLIFQEISLTAQQCCSFNLCSRQEIFLVNGRDWMRNVMYYVRVKDWHQRETKNLKHCGNRLVVITFIKRGCTTGVIKLRLVASLFQALR